MAVVAKLLQDFINPTLYLIHSTDLNIPNRYLQYILSKRPDVRTIANAGNPSPHSRMIMEYSPSIPVLYNQTSKSVSPYLDDK
jgi:hypothetical protein